MKKTRRAALEKRAVARNLILLYAAAVVIRFLIALTQSTGPSIIPDEALYSNIARSILTQGRVLMHGQPVIYDSLLYPLLLIPLYILPKGIDMFRTIQLYNILLMTSCIFPGFLLARRFLGKDRPAWIVTLFLLILPDMALGQLLISECICYPLLFWMMYMAMRAFDGSFNLKDAFVVALLSALLYFTKPGLVAIGPIFCIFYILYAIKEHSGNWKNALASLAMLAVLFGLIQVMTRFVFQIDYNKESIYGSQAMELTATNLFVVFQGFILLLYFFPISSGILPVVLPAAGTARVDKRRKYFIIMLFAALLVTMVGVAYIIFLYEWRGQAFFGRVHIRYLAAFIPVLIMFAMSDDLEGMKLNWTSLVLFVLLFAGTLLLTPGARKSTGTETIDALTLSAFSMDWLGIPTKTVVLILLLLAIPLICWVLWRKGYTRRFRVVMLSCLAGLMLLNNVTGYALLYAGKDERQAADAVQVPILTSGRTVLYITENDYYNDYSIALDIQYREPLESVTLNDLAVSMQYSDGTYAPFFPHSYKPTYPDHDTPDADTLIADAGVMKMLELAPGINAQWTANDCYAIIPIQRGQPFLKSLLAGPVKGVATAGDTSTILLFPSSLTQKGRILLKLRAGVDAPVSLSIQTSMDFATCDLNGDDEWYRLELSVSPGMTEQIELTCATEDVRFFDYEIAEIQ